MSARIAGRDCLIDGGGDTFRLHLLNCAVEQERRRDRASCGAR
jgi:hypothetical protein